MADLLFLSGSTVSDIAESFSLVRVYSGTSFSGSEPALYQWILIKTGSKLNTTPEPAL